MYWSEWESHRVYQADKFHGRNVTAVTTHLASVPMGIQVSVSSACVCLQFSFMIVSYYIVYCNLVAASLPAASTAEPVRVR